MIKSFFKKIQNLKLFLSPTKVVIIDKINNVEDEIMKKFKVYDYVELSYPNTIYLNVLIRSIIIKILKGYKLRISYYLCFIQIADPKLVLTFTDNNVFFYSLKNLIKKKIYFISHQNGWRANLSDLFDKKIQKPVSQFDLCCDYIFSFSKLSSSLYRDIIKCKVIETGCFINNRFKSVKFKTKKVKKLIFISTSDFNVEKRYKIKNQYFFSYEKAVMKFIFEYCLENNISLYIYPKFIHSRKEYKTEINFFKENLPLKFFNKKWFMVKKNNPLYIYKNISKYDLAISTDSTLGYELLARGFKCVILKARRDYLKKKFNINFSESFDYGWPQKQKKNYGYFWTNKYDKKIFNQLLTQVGKLSNRKWDEILYIERNRLYTYDHKNKKFYNILKKIIHEK